MSRLDKPNVTLAVVTLSHAVNHMYTGVLPLLYTPMLNELGLTYTQLGVIIAVHLFTLGVMQFGSSVLARYMPRRILLGVGTFLLGVGNFVVGLSQTLLQVMLGRIVAGVGGSPQHPVGITLIAERFKTKARGSALGLHFSLAFAGNIVGPVAAGIFLLYLGWRMALYIMIIPTLIMGVLVMLLIKERKPVVEESSKTGVWRDVKKVLTTRKVVLLFLAQLFAAGAGQGVLLNYTPIILTESFGLAAEGAERIFFYTLFLVGGVAGPMAMGRLSDRFGRRVIGVLVPLSTALLLFLFITAAQPSVLLAGILLLLGVNAFAIPIIIQTILSDLTSATFREVTLGIYYTLTFAFSSMWVASVGYFADLYQSFTPVMMVAILSVVMTSVFLYFGSSGRQLWVEDL